MVVCLKTARLKREIERLQKMREDILRQLPNKQTLETTPKTALTRR